MAIHTKVLTVDVDLTATIIATATATIVSNTIEVATVVVVVTSTILQLQPAVSTAPFTERLVTTSRSTALCGRTTNKTSTSKWNNVVVLGPQQQQRVCPIRMGQRQQGDERSSDD